MELPTNFQVEKKVKRDRFLDISTSHNFAIFTFNAIALSYSRLRLCTLRAGTSRSM
jgi:hypothetical protein